MQILFWKECISLCEDNAILDYFLCFDESIRMFVAGLYFSGLFVLINFNKLCIWLSLCLETDANLVRVEYSY
jgi:hypothetical protein